MRPLNPGPTYERKRYLSQPQTAKDFARKHGPDMTEPADLRICRGVGLSSHSRVADCNRSIDPGRPADFAGRLGFGRRGRGFGCSDRDYRYPQDSGSSVIHRHYHLGA
jgi:hypothetical protein